MGRLSLVTLITDSIRLEEYALWQINRARNLPYYAVKITALIRSVLLVTLVGACGGPLAARERGREL